MKESKQTRIPTKEKSSMPATKKARTATGKTVRSGSKKNPKGTALKMSENDLSVYVTQSISTKKRVPKEEITPKKLKFPSKESKEIKETNKTP